MNKISNIETLAADKVYQLQSVVKLYKALGGGAK